MRTLIAIGAVIAILLIWSLCPLVARWLVGSDKTGELGDTFGAVNALFSGLAFAGLIFTISFQRDELKLQREELALTRINSSALRKRKRSPGELWANKQRS